MVFGYFFWTMILFTLLVLITISMVSIFNKKSSWTPVGKFILTLVVIFMSFSVWSIFTTPHKEIYKNGSSMNNYHTVTYYNYIQTDSVTVRVHDDEVLVGKITKISNSYRDYRIHITVSDGKKLEYTTHETIDMNSGTINVVKSYFPSVTYKVNGTTCW